MVETRTHERLHASEPTMGSDRTFGVVFAAFFTVVAVLPWVRGGHGRVWALPVAGGLLLVALVRPRLLRPAHWLWFRLGLLLQRVTSPTLLGLVFFGVITPVAIVRRLSGADPLRLKRPPADGSTWTTRATGVVTPDSLRRQF
jgi:hypothetical protein